MGRKGRRRLLAKNIYQDEHGIGIVVQVRGIRSPEHRFDLGTELDTLIRNRDQIRADLHDEAPVVARGTLAFDAERYFKLIAGRPGFAADRSHLRAWVDRLGTKHRSRIGPTDVRAVLAAWRSSGTWSGGRGTRERTAVDAPASEKTLKERWRVLKHLYKTLDGPKAKTPCDDVPRPKPQKPTPVGVPIATIRNVSRSLQKRAQGTRRTSLERKDYARFQMLATTAQRPAQLARAERADFHPTFWIVRGAKGGPSHAIALNADMRGAVRAFLSAEAFGPFDSTRFARLLRQHGWPAAVRPYNARHSVAIDAIQRGVNLGDLQALLGHDGIDTTRRFYAPILALRQQEIGKRLDGRLKTG